MLAAMGGLALGGAVVLLIAMLLATGEAGRLDPGTQLETLGEPLDPFADVASGVSAPEAPVIGGQPDELVVDVAGAVMQPGLHRLGGGARVGDAIEAAGGFGPRVDLGAASQVLNLAQPLEDGVKVLVPELGIDDVTPRNEADGRIDLNNASQDELESLPGIGPVTAAKIIAARAQSPFKSVPDVRARGVVGQSVFDDIADLVRVSP
jgi:competence protein ComEA